MGQLRARSPDPRISVLTLGPVISDGGNGHWQPNDCTEAVSGRGHMKPVTAIPRQEQSYTRCRSRLENSFSVALEVVTAHRTTDGRTGRTASTSSFGPDITWPFSGPSLPYSWLPRFRGQRALQLVLP
jgi:hypothetical protein